MGLLTILLTLFVMLELSNALALYFNPTLKQANAVGVFKAWDDSKANRETHNFVRYLVYWVAGTKLIFLSLLSVILIFGNDMTKLLGTLSLVISIGVYYWKMHPLLRVMDTNGELTPSGYSKQLGIMIFIIMFALLGGAVSFILY
ncbi:hypothetical protein H6762_00975 [Candidatus Nomurabacteria bacterium]|uniref:Uncharacterized protein n=1 Tax=Candidatus Dojkabacteria bacterium TaxID=2099670 RepID=A0A955KWU8_9BACT|nr:hypothetical protein [Candidatus Dojkabacteria bacterium]MCB9789550.1 hypothetical protein [Candidatus Nomurabacteria bacterium]